MRLETRQTLKPWQTKFAVCEECKNLQRFRLRLRLLMPYPFAVAFLSAWRTLALLLGLLMSRRLAD
jgi:hypothetical protein